LRLLLFNTDLEIGGTPTVVRELALRLRDPRTQVEVASLKTVGPVGAGLGEQGVEVHALDARSPLDLRRAARRLRSTIESRGIDTVLSFLVHANTVAASVSSSMPNVRFVQSIQTTQPRPRWHWPVQRWAARSAQRVIVPGPSVARVARDWCDVPESLIDLIPNALDLGRFSFAPRPIDPSSVRVGFVGRLDPVKRVGDLIHALTHLPASIRAEIFGEGIERPRLEALVKQLGLTGRVTFHGRVDDPMQAYRSIDLLVLPSEAEGFGLVLIEAMACGVPVIGTDVDGIRDVIAPGTGILALCRDPQSLAGAIGHCVEIDPIRSGMIGRAVEHVRSTYTWDATIPRWRAALAA
jgi:glycosyltransferase involved in cell wall biosynthesis